MTAPVPKVSTRADLFAIAWQIEADAVERYDQLAKQMESFNNPELAALFRDLARAEAIHRDEIRRMADDPQIEARAHAAAQWTGDSPEQADLAASHYLMTPWHALQLALAGEKRALAFFQEVSASTSDPVVKKIADGFAAEEAEHVELVERLLLKYPEPPENWAHDPDPPVPQG